MGLRAIHRWVRRGFITFAVGSTAFLIWSVQARGVPAAWLDSDAQVRVARDGYGRLFSPVAAGENAAAVVFLPGGLVDPDAYVPLARALALEGFPVALVELPWRSAPTPASEQVLWTRIETARAALTGRRIVLAGHSRGGMFASVFTADHPGALAGLVLIGTTHPRDRDLSDAALPVLKILGSEDCVAAPRAARANAAMLPPHTQWIEIAGGNHRQFGYYGWQLGDCAAAISREEQHRQTVAAIAGFARSLEAGDR